MSMQTDEQRLRRALRIIGDEFAEPDSEPAPQAGTARLRGPAHDHIPGDRIPSRPARWTRAALAVAAVAVVAAVSFAVVNDSGSGTPDSSSRRLTDPQLVACSPAIGIGAIEAVDPGAAPEQRQLTVRVDRWLKEPPTAEALISFEAMSGDFSDDPDFAAGQKLLFYTQLPDDYPALVYRAGGKPGQALADGLELYEKNQGAAADLRCPRWLVDS